MWKIFPRVQILNKNRNWINAVYLSDIALAWGNIVEVEAEQWKNSIVYNIIYVSILRLRSQLYVCELWTNIDLSYI